MKYAQYFACFYCKFAIQCYLMEKTRMERTAMELLPTNYMEEESYAILGAVYEVYKTLGCGFLEEVYQESLGKEMELRGIPFVSQKCLQLNYKGYHIKQTYKPDMICYDRIILELKAISNLCGEHEAQLHNYLKATGIRLGFLVNFGHFPKVEIRRIVR